MYFRSTDQNGFGIWAKVLNNYGDQSISGKFTAGTISSGSSIETSKTSFTKFQLARHDWSGSHALLFNAYKDYSVNGSLSTTGNVKYANDVGSYSSGAGAIMFFGNGGVMDFFISPTSSGEGTSVNWGIPKMRILRDGSVGIGTATPTHRLEVNGTIRSKEVKVEATGWPDYVFESDYNLRSLEETEAYIKANKHLPEIPSAKEMEANGVQLGEMNMLLLKKIEELTLHMIKMNKENMELRKQLKSNSQSQDKKIEELTLQTIQLQKLIEAQEN